jgi:DNA-binding LacI/PurR family transcriptional regulator
MIGPSAYQAISYLVNQGYRKIGGIMGPRSVTPGKERYDAFTEALQAYKEEVIEEYTKNT